MVNLLPYCKKGDLDILVSVFEDKTVFVNEYQVLLSEKLLSLTDFNTDSHVGP